MDDFSIALAKLVGKLDLKEPQIQDTRVVALCHLHGNTE
jgi:hypothetical protein